MSKPTTRIDAIGDNLYRISTAMPPPIVPGGFTFNQYLLIDEAPLLFHTGLRSHFDTVSQAIATVTPWTSCATSRSATWKPTSAAP